MKVRQPGPPWLEPLDPFERLANGGVRRMWCVSQRIQDQRVQPAQPFQRLFRQPDDIVAIGKGSDPEADRRDAAMVLREGEDLDLAARTADPDRLPLLQVDQPLQNGRVALGALEAVVEAL